MWLFKIPSRVHLTGIGGIGMSALGQMLNWLGCEVSGSDRASGAPENLELFGALRAQGIKIYPQDGSFASHAVPDCLIYSTAIEKDNPDFTVLPELPRVHRAEALATALKKISEGRISIAVTGTSGKTTVTSWIGEFLENCGADPVVVSGGIINSFRSDRAVGNFRPGEGAFAVFEADESDKSLTAFRPQCSVVLNIGNDHYPSDQIAEMFSDFLSGTSSSAVIETETLRMLDKSRFPNLKIISFSSATGGETDLENGAVCWRVRRYIPDSMNSTAVLCSPSGEEFTLELPVPGFHNALNAAAVAATAEICGFPLETIRRNLPLFRGVHRRFNMLGRTSSGAAVFDDYAHNPEKISSSIRTAKEISRGRIILIFQPHGFGPLDFMRKSLFNALEKEMGAEDIACFLPVYYAGGSSSFKPSSAEIVDEFGGNGRNRYVNFGTREEAEQFIMDNAGKDDLVLIAGARDGSLPLWARKNMVKNGFKG